MFFIRLELILKTDNKSGEEIGKSRKSRVHYSSKLALPPVGRATEVYRLV